ncbi:MAG: MFS transporter [Chloroflexi bacterium]|nr:MFS transporter [Chloroflexota bacterium]
MVPLLPVLAGDFATNVGTAGGVIAAYSIPYGLFQLGYGPIGDRVGKLRVMIVAMILFAAGTFACAFAPTLGTLITLRFLTGAAAAGLIPLTLAYIGDHFSYQDRQAAIGSYLASVALGSILGTSIGGVVADFLSWRSIFLAYGAISVGVFALMWRAGREFPEERKPGPLVDLASFRAYGRLLREPAPRLVLIAVFVEGFFFFGAFAYMGAFLRETYGLPYLAIGVILSGFGIGNLIYSRTSRWVIRVLGENGQVLVGGWLMCGGYLVIALVASWPLFALVNVVLGVGFVLLHTTLQTKATELAPGARGTTIALFAFCLFMGQGLGTAAQGWLVNQAGYSVALITAAIPMVLLVQWFVWVVRRQSGR